MVAEAPAALGLGRTVLMAEMDAVAVVAAEAEDHGWGSGGLVPVS